MSETQEPVKYLLVNLKYECYTNFYYDKLVVGSWSCNGLYPHNSTEQY